MKDLIEKLKMQFCWKYYFYDVFHFIEPWKVCRVRQSMPKYSLILNYRQLTLCFLLEGLVEKVVVRTPHFQAFQILNPPHPLSKPTITTLPNPTIPSSSL